MPELLGNAFSHLLWHITTERLLFKVVSIDCIGPRPTTTTDMYIFASSTTPLVALEVS